MIHFYRECLQILQQDAVAIATVVHSKGSVPREVGARMAIGADGRLVGTIGGGAGEALVIRQAMTVLQTGESQRVTIDLTGAPQRQTQGICGGVMQVWVARWSGTRAIALVQQILHQLQSGQPITLVTPLATDHCPYTVSGEKVMILSGTALKTMAFSPDSLNLGDTTSPSVTEAFVETVQPPPTLLIVGAGHVGRQLAIVADQIGFQVVIQDNRPEWANSHYYPQATLILTEAIAPALACLHTHQQIYAALVTRGYQYDLDALTALLQRPLPCRYIGMIGSEKRVRQVFQALETAGIPSAKLQSINAPIGLDIGALTPEEIAVSIGAELVLVRRGGTGHPLSEQFRHDY